MEEALCYTFQQVRVQVYTEAGMSIERMHANKSTNESINVLREMKNIGVGGRRLGFGAPTDRDLETHIPMSRSTQQTVLAVMQEEFLLSGLDLVLRDAERMLEGAHTHDRRRSHWRVRVREGKEVELERRVDRLASGREHEVEAIILTCGVSWKQTDRIFASRKGLDEDLRVSWVRFQLYPP